MNVETAENARIANILAMISLAEGRPYDVILVDMQMPKAIGTESVKWLRQHGWQGPIIGIGADVNAEDRKYFSAIGCDDYVSNPLTDKKLLAAFSRLTRRSDEGTEGSPVEDATAQIARAEDAAARAASTGDETTPIDSEDDKMHGRILVVEDAICIQTIVGAFLQRMGFEVATADNGRSGCDMALESLTQGNPYDVILMDIQLPKMNGKKAAKWLRENGWKGPIIAASIHATDRNREEFIKAGCDSYISKPITEAGLRSALSACLHPE